MGVAAARFLTAGGDLALVCREGRPRGGGGRRRAGARDGSDRAARGRGGARPPGGPPAVGRARGGPARTRASSAAPSIASSWRRSSPGRARRRPPVRPGRIPARAAASASGAPAAARSADPGNRVTRRSAALTPGSDRDDFLCRPTRDPRCNLASRRAFTHSELAPGGAVAARRRHRYGRGFSPGGRHRHLLGRADSTVGAGSGGSPASTLRRIPARSRARFPTSMPPLTSPGGTSSGRMCSFTTH